MKFTVSPGPGPEGFEDWRDAVKGVCRLPAGLPEQFRRKTWMTLADHYIDSLGIDWNRTRKAAFNERSNPDDHKLGAQIVKDLHRTGCSGFSGQDNEQDRVVLKRVLLAYARWNKTVGYCQGLNILAALILEVVNKREEEALKVMIYLLEGVLPEGYFGHNLRALSVDMVVFRELLHAKLPDLAAHLDLLQKKSAETSGRYEPPLTNVFTMQWFLTLFATCLPKEAVLRVWDCILLDGSHVLLRTALAIWSKLGSSLYKVASADEFYTTMGSLSMNLVVDDAFNVDVLIKDIYSCGELSNLAELREKYAYNITPFRAIVGNKKDRLSSGGQDGDDDGDVDDEELAKMVSCFAAFVPMLSGGQAPRKSIESDRGSSGDVSSVTPGAVASGHSEPCRPGAHERCTDLRELHKQYERLRERQKQASVMLQAAHEEQLARCRQKGAAATPTPLTQMVVSTGSRNNNGIVAITSKSSMVNHLLIKPPNTNEEGPISAKPTSVRRSSSSASLSKALSASPRIPTPSTRPEKPFSPFPQRYISRSIAENGIRLGLYSPGSALSESRDKVEKKVET